MTPDDLKPCPYCAEPIRAAAVKCRYCGSLLGPAAGAAAGTEWRRVRQGSRLSGICTGIARQFGRPDLVLPLRVFFVVTTLFYGFGVLLYLILRFLMGPPDPDEDRPPAEVAPTDL